MQKAAQEISDKLKHAQKNNTVEQNIALAINQYLNDDIFYHNRKRRILAQQLLTQLRADNLAYNEGESLQKKYKMRTTLEKFIKKIDEDFKNTHFFSKYYTSKRSRLSTNLEIIKEVLIRNNYLSALELESQVKQPINKTIKLFIQGNTNPTIARDINTLMTTIQEAQTPHAIEAILEAHIRSYLECANQSDLLTLLKNLLTGTENIYFTLALKLESALLDWQANNILPAASGYKTFLQTLATHRQNNENDLQRLENQYKIKIPRTPKDMQTQANTIQQKASNLLKRIQKL